MATQEHTAKAFDIDLQEITRLLAEMGGLAEKQIAERDKQIADAEKQIGLGAATGASPTELDQLLQPPSSDGLGR